MQHGLTSAGFDDLRRLNPNLAHLPSWKAAQTQLLKISGLKPILYDCCVNSCCCYTGPHSNKTECPYCGEACFNSKHQSRWRFSYLPLIPRLRAYLANQEKAQQMLYRSQVFVHNPDSVKDIFDGTHYQSLLGKKVTVNGQDQGHYHFDGLCNIALGLSTNGYAPFKHRKKTAWPILIFNYNLPPDERTHDNNVLYVGVVPGPNKPINFDSFLWPLVNELLVLKTGIKAWDAIKKEVFTLCAFLLIIFGDIPAVSMVMRMKGHNGICPCRYCKIHRVRIPEDTHSPYYVPLDRSKHPEAKAPHSIARYDPANLPHRTHNGFLAQA
jgi:hypothetical protein